MILTGRVNDNHLGLRRNGLLKLIKIDSPLGRRRSPRCSVFRRVHGDIDDLPARHLDVADVSKRVLANKPP